MPTPREEAKVRFKELTDEWGPKLASEAIDLLMKQYDGGATTLKVGLRAGPFREALKEVATPFDPLARDEAFGEVVYRVRREIFERFRADGSELFSAYVKLPMFGKLQVGATVMHRSERP